MSLQGILNFNLGKEKYVWLYINSSMDEQNFRHYILIVELHSLSFISLHCVGVQESHRIVMALGHVGSTHKIKQ